MSFIRQEAYSVITGTLGQLLQQAQTPSSPAVPIKPGPPPSSTSEQRVDPARDVSNDICPFISVISPYLV